MKKFISKTGIVLTLIFSFLLSLFAGIMSATSVSAAEVIQETVELTSIKREGNTITFTTKLVYDVDSITYEIVYYEGTEKYADLITDAEVKKINDFDYSFEVSDSIIGVKIWKIKHFVSTNYFKNKMTTGNTSVGDVEAIYKKNYIEVTTDKLEVLGGLDDDLDTFFGSTAYKTYIFYFNLDTVIDKIIDLSLEYSIKKEKETWWGLGGYSYTESYEVKLDHTQQVTDYYAASDYLVNWLENYNGDDKAVETLNQIEYAKNTFKRDVLGANANGNGYDWYVQPLLDVELTDKNYIFGSGYQRQDLQEVAIVKMSYYSQGEYYEDIPVLDEDTGWIKYESDNDSWWDEIVSWFKKNVTIVSIITGFIILVIAFKLINIPLSWFGLGMDKTSRLERKLDKQYKRQLKAAKSEIALNKLESKQAKKNRKKEKKIRRNGYNRSNSNYHFH